MNNSIITDTLKKLEQSFVAKNYDEARELLLSVKPKLPDGFFHYNLGTILAAEGQYPAARYNFELAKKKDFNHPALYKNLHSVESALSVNSSTYSVRESLVTQFIALDSSVFLAAGLVLSILTIMVLKKISKVKVYISFVITLLFLTPFISKVTYFNNEYHDAINLKDLEVYQGPSSIYDVVDTLPAGRKFIISKGNDGWYFILYPNKFSGWVKRDDLAIY